MIVIIEGVDLSGKTHAIEIISKFFNSGFVLKNSYKPKTAEFSEVVYMKYWNILKMLRDINPAQLIILDRFYPSQAVYSILRHKCEMHDKRIIELDEYCNEEDVLYIYLDTDEKVLLERFKDRGDEHIKDFKQIMMLKERYDKFFRETKLCKLKIDTTKEGWLEDVKKFIEGKR